MERKCSSWPLVVAGVIAALLGACAPSESQMQARAFVEALVLNPDNRGQLAELANDQARPLEALIDNVAVRVAVGFLRTRRAQGAALAFRADRRRAHGSGHEEVIVVADLREGETVSADAMHFRVELAPAAAGRWRVAALAVAN